MLTALSIRDIVIIDRLDVAFTPGLSVLTGETGAGKSILLDAFALALGGRGDAGLVRDGAAQGQVTAVFELPGGHPVAEILAENGLDGDDTLILRRQQATDGRTRAFVNDQPASVQLLRRIGATLVEIHGQHDDRALADPATHRGLLDAFGGLEADAAALAEHWRAWRASEDALAEARSALAAAGSEREFLEHARDELDQLTPEAGEEAALAERRTLMMQAEKIAEELSEVERAISGEGSPAAALSAALRRLERRGEQFPDLVGPVVDAVDRALVALDEARTAGDEALRRTAFEPRELEAAEERLFALRAAARKHGVQVEELPRVHADIAAQLAAIEDGGERVARLEGEAAAAREAYTAAASALSERRRQAGAALDAAVMAELEPLKLERARFETRVESDGAAAGPHGHDRVEFWAQTNPGSRPGPVMKIASGGELSRFMLALKVALADMGSAPTLVFDEIDTAVGGAVSDAIGRRLARLAERVQVLSITHAPQVAARAASHMLIYKGGDEGGTERVATRVRTLDDAAREEEIARMLAGATVTAEARAAASRLIEETR